MAAYDGSIRIDTKIDSTGFNQGVSTITKGFSAITKAAGAVGVALSAAYIAKSLIQIGKQAINTASDLAEVQNVVNVVFGKSADAIEEFADSALENYGLSELAAKRYASTLGAMLKSMGLNSDAIVSMSKNLAGLAGDMASFYNLDTDTAFEKLRSGISGETEPLKQLGINLSEANLKAFALSQGIDKSYSAMSESEKVMLRYKYILSVTADAQGDFARTSDSWANQTRLLSENWKELLGILGNGLIQVLLPVVHFLNTIVEALIKVAKAIQAVLSVFGKNKGSTDNLINENNNLSMSAGEAAENEEKLASGLTTAGKAARSALAQFDQLDILQSNMGGNAGLDNFETPDFGDFDINLDTAKGNLNEFEADFKNFLVGLKDQAQDFVIQPVVEPVFEPIPDPVYEPNWNLNPNPVVEPVFEPIPDPVYEPNWNLNPNPVVEPVFEPIPDPVYVPVWGINDSLITEQELVFATLAVLSSGMRSILEEAFNALPVIYEKALQSAETAYQNYNSNYIAVTSKIQDDIASWDAATSGVIQNWKHNVTQAVYDAAANIISNANSLFETTYENTVEWASKNVEAFVAWGKGASDVVWNSVKSMATTFLNGLKTMWENFKEVTAAVGGKISSEWNENKSWLVPAAAVIGGAAAIGAALVLSGGSLTAPLMAAAALPLAEGAVIPPNQEFLAVLGDQKRGRNLEAPEGLIRQIMREELAGLQTSGGDITITFDGNLAQLARVLNPVIKKENRRIGTTLQTGGAY